MAVDFPVFDIGIKGAIAWTDECGKVCSRPYVLEGDTGEERLVRLENLIDDWLHYLT